MGIIFFEITVIICLAALLVVLFRYLKQPPILSYIVTGILVGPVGLLTVHAHSQEVLQSLAEIGITLLLFMLGLELRLKELKSVGKIALMTGVGQIVFTSMIGFFVCLLLGFSSVTAMYVAIALTFSSTIVIVKLLSDKKDLKSLYGKIAISILLLQDFVAIVALIILSGFTKSTGAQLEVADFILLALKGVALFGWVYVFSQTLLPKLVNSIARNSEVLFLFSLGWAFGMSALVSSPYIGFSIEIGGFLAGIALANSSESFQIVAKVRPLRDFFITIFFVTLGMKMVFANIMAIFLPSVFLALFVLIGNPLIVMLLLSAFGYKTRTAFMTGITMSQISEFSMIVIFMGSKIGHVSDQAISLVTMVGAITFVTSTYMILHGNALYQKVAPFLRILERDTTHEAKMSPEVLKGHVILIGANRMGESILEALIHNNEQVVVVDFDPDVIARLREKNIPCFYGDIADLEIQEKVGLYEARLIISTVPDVEDNLLMLEGVKRHNKKAVVVVFALETEDAKQLYKAGAHYVVLPHLAGGRHVAKILIDKNHLEMIEKYKAKDLSYIV